MVGNLQTSMFLLCTFVLPVNPINQAMALVNVCPQNETEVIQASNRLGCGKDKFDKNQYLCLPNKEKTSLVEFCYQGVMGLLEKGSCIEFSEGKWIYHSCNHFVNGCPEKNLEVVEIYRYPACQNISTHLQCYVMDKNCTAKPDTGGSSGQNNVVLITCISIGVLILFIISCIIIVFLYKRKMANRNKKKGDADKSSDETSTLLSERNNGNINLELEISKPERNKENINLELEISKPGEGDQEKVTDTTTTPVSGEGDQEKVTDTTTTPVSVADASFPMSFKLPFYMEKETVELMLHRLKMGDCVETFKKEDLDLNLLLELSENDLNDTLEKTNLTIGKRAKIYQEIKAMQSRIQSWKGKEIRMVLIGSTRSRKNATVDTILGNTFSFRWSPVISECVKKSNVRLGHNICIVNTPGICQFNTTNAKIQKEILKCISISSPGPHAIIYVISNLRCTDDEHNFIQYFEDLFGEHFFKFLIILLTIKDYFDNRGKSLEDHIKTLPSNLQADIKKCGERVIAFNNKLLGEKGEDQVKELLSMIINNVKDNGECYNSEMYMEAEKRLHDRETKILEKEQMDKNVREPKKRPKNKTI